MERHPTPREAVWGLAEATSALEVGCRLFRVYVLFTLIRSAPYGGVLLNLDEDCVISRESVRHTNKEVTDEKKEW